MESLLCWVFIYSSRSRLRPKRLNNKIVLKFCPIQFGFLPLRTLYIFKHDIIQWRDGTYPFTFAMSLMPLLESTRNWSSTQLITLAAWYQIETVFVQSNVPYPSFASSIKFSLHAQRKWQYTRGNSTDVIISTSSRSIDRDPAMLERNDDSCSLFHWSLLFSNNVGPVTRSRDP